MPMYNDSYGESGWMRLLRALSATFRVGWFFGVELRVFWLTVIVLPLICIFEFATYASGLLEVLTLTALLTAALYTVVYTHEMGHIAMGWRYGIRTPLITLSPLGGVAHMGAAAPTPGIELRIALAGPAVHLLWLAVFWPLSLLLTWDSLRPAAWSLSPLMFAVDFLVAVNFWVMLFNLLPCFPMDGGRALRALLATRMHPNKATLLACNIGTVGAVGFILYGLFLGQTWGFILIAIGITNLMACRQEIRVARHVLIYGHGGGLAEWQTDPDAWKAGTAADPAATPRRGFLARWRDKRRRARRERQHAADVALNAEVDLVLERISQVGMAGLTDAEKRVLKRAAQRRRDTG